MPFTKFRGSQAFIAVILLGSMQIPFPALIIKLRYLVFFTKNLLLLTLRYRPAFPSFCTTVLTFFSWSSLVLLEQIRTLSTYIEHYLLSLACSTQLMYYQNVLGAFISLNSVTNYLYNLKQVQKVVFYLLPLVILTLQKA